jgi:hypothetical protein
MTDDEWLEQNRAQRKTRVTGRVPGHESESAGADEYVSTLRQEYADRQREDAAERLSRREDRENKAQEHWLRAFTPDPDHVGWVYKYERNGVPVYIGQTIRVSGWWRRAVAEHRRDPWFSSELKLYVAVVKPVLFTDVRETELIHYWHPAGNNECRGCRMRLPRELSPEAAALVWKPVELR